MKLNDNKKIKIKQKQVLIYISSKYYYSEHIKPEFWAKIWSKSSFFLKSSGRSSSKYNYSHFDRLYLQYR